MQMLYRSWTARVSAARAARSIAWHIVQFVAFLATAMRSVRQRAERAPAFAWGVRYAIYELSAPQLDFEIIVTATQANGSLADIR